MQLWKELVRINGLTLRLMHNAKDIRANYAVCISRQQGTAGSVAVIHCFSCIFAIGKWLFFNRIHASCDLGGQTGVLWGPLAFLLDPMEQFCDIILRRAALGTKYECLVWVLLHITAGYAQYR